MENSNVAMMHTSVEWVKVIATPILNVPLDSNVEIRIARNSTLSTFFMTPTVVTKVHVLETLGATYSFTLFFS